MITRVFDYEDPNEATLAVTYSVTPELKRFGYQQLLPSFAYPPALLREFSAKEISEMFSHIAATYLSKRYQQTRDWHGFIKQRATAATLSSWMMELGQIVENSADFHELFITERTDGSVNLNDNQTAKDIVDLLVSACLDAFPDFFESLGLPSAIDALDQQPRTNWQKYYTANGSLSRSWICRCSRFRRSGNANCFDSAFKRYCTDSTS